MSDQNSLYIIVFMFFLILLSVFLIFTIMKLRKRLKLQNSDLQKLKEKYFPIINIEDEINKKEEELTDIEDEILITKDDYLNKREVYKSLIQQIEIYEEDLELIEMGAFIPIFKYDTPDSYKKKIEEVTNLQKEMIKSKQAVISTTDWVVNGSKAEGKKLTNQSIRLVSRAFNNEVNVIIKNVSWRNFDASLARIEKAFFDINKFSESNNIHISVEYLKLKKEEMELVYEYQLKIQEQKEELAEAKRLIREEEKLQSDRLKAQKEEEKYAALLKKAQQDLIKSTGKELDALNEKISQLSMQLEEAHQANERAISMAQQTKSGFVYIISNIGSFGENVYKIGMTRRLEPLDRVKELSGASVPFVFDTHAMIYSKDAPGLEAKLHNRFSERRVNLANFRKEYFNVSLEEIEQEVSELGIECEFFRVPEAEEYRKTKILKKEAEEKREEVEAAFPEFI